jgi:hypothetical protein
LTNLWRFSATGAQERFISKAPNGSNAVAIDPSGRIVMTGSYELVRVDPTTLATDNAYDQNVNMVLNGGSAAVSGLAIAFDTFGRTLFVGDKIYDPGGPPPQAVLWRFMPGGTLDTSFGSGGVLAFPNAILQGSLVPPTAASTDGCNLIVAGLAWSTFVVAKVDTCCDHDQ